ncbi:MAG: amidohydrolase family protein [Capsulimonadales bacterium]|nr:amidohydrolase family protein [Capsulimonadales bacterium]
MTVPAEGTAPVPIIDCDIHPSTNARPVGPYIPAAFQEAMRQGMGGQPGHGYSNPFGVDRRDAACDDPKQVAIDLFDRYGIVYGVLQPPGYNASLTTNPDVGTAKARAWNDWQAAEWLDADPRYLGSICINTVDATAAAREIRRAKASHTQFVQVVVCSESFDLYGHRRYFPIYEACEELGLPFAIHPGSEGCLRSSTPVGRPSNYFEWHTGIPLTFQAHLISLVTEGVFEHFPGLRIILVEGGVSWLSHTMWRMDKNFKALRSLTPWLKRAPSEYLIDHVRLSTQPTEEPTDPRHLLPMLEMIRAEKTLCYASDFPHWDFDDPRCVLPGADAALRRRVLYENAAELYRLPPLSERTGGTV